MASVRVQHDGIEVEVRAPRDELAGWRWFITFQLIRLAAWIYPFKLRFFRETEWIDEVEH